MKWRSKDKGRWKMPETNKKWNKRKEKSGMQGTKEGKWSRIIKREKCTPRYNYIESEIRRGRGRKREKKFPSEINERGRGVRVGIKEETEEWKINKGMTNRR